MTEESKGRRVDDRRAAGPLNWEGERGSATTSTPGIDLDCREAFKKWHDENGDQDCDYTWQEAWKAALARSAQPAAAGVDERAAFEAWAKPQSYWWNGQTYSDLHTQVAWDAWQARAAHPAGQAGATVGSIDTPEFQEIVENWRNQPYGTRSFLTAWDELIAHIDAKLAKAAAPVSPAQPAAAGVEERAMDCGCKSPVKQCNTDRAGCKMVATFQARAAHPAGQAGATVGSRRENKELARILFGMCEGAGADRDADIYADDYQAGDGDVYVYRAAEVLVEQDAEIDMLLATINLLSDKLAAPVSPQAGATVGSDAASMLSGALNHAREALRFYSEQLHFHMHQPDQWDTVSGEPSNFYEDENSTATVEDGTVAKQALEAVAMVECYAQAAAPVSPAQPEASAQEPIGYISHATLEKLLGDDLAADEHVMLWHAENPPSRAVLPVYLASPVTAQGDERADVAVMNYGDPVDKSAVHSQDSQPEGQDVAQSVDELEIAYHDVVTSLRTYANDPGYSHNDYADTMREAAHCIESLRAMFYHYAAMSSQESKAGSKANGAPGSTPTSDEQQSGNAAAGNAAGLSVSEAEIDAYIAFTSHASYLSHPDVPYHGTDNGDSPELWKRRLVAALIRHVLAARPAAEKPAGNAAGLDEDPDWMGKIPHAFQNPAAEKAGGLKGMRAIKDVGLPPFDEVVRVLVYTEGVDFNGEQFFELNASDLHEYYDKTEVAIAATHWMPLPYPDKAAAAGAAGQDGAA